MNNFKKYRLELGLTQRDLANLLYLHQSCLSKYENNSRNPSFDVCYRLIKLINKLKNIDIKLEELRPE